MDYLTAHTSLSAIRHGFAPDFVNYQKGCTRLAATSYKVYQLLSHGRWFSLGIAASSTTKTGRHDIAEILLNVALNTKNQINQINIHVLFNMHWRCSYPERRVGLTINPATFVCLSQTRAWISPNIVCGGLFWCLVS